MNTFDGLHQALRWLRNRRGLQQKEIAEAAGITRGMLSAYENGKQNPSLETLDKLLQALGAGLPELYEALSLQQGAQVPPARPSASTRPPLDNSTVPAGLDLNLYKLLDIDRPLSVDQEHALRQVLAGFHQLVRAKLRELDQGLVPPHTTDD